MWIPAVLGVQAQIHSKATPCAPMALANDSFYGYAPAIIYEWLVRWIEAAAACPAWTSMILLYLEADHEHLMREVMHKPQHRIGVRGNVYSFPMPWEDIYTPLGRAIGYKELALLPHDE